MEFKLNSKGLIGLVKKKAPSFLFLSFTHCACSLAGEKTKGRWYSESRRVSHGLTPDGAGFGDALSLLILRRMITLGACC